MEAERVVQRAGSLRKTHTWLEAEVIKGEAVIGGSPDTCLCFLRKEQGSPVGIRWHQANDCDLAVRRVRISILRHLHGERHEALIRRQSHVPDILQHRVAWLITNRVPDLAIRAV